MVSDVAFALHCVRAIALHSLERVQMRELQHYDTRVVARADEVADQLASSHSAAGVEHCIVFEYIAGRCSGQLFLFGFHLSE